MQPIIVVLIILLATLGNSALFILGFLKTPPGFVFLGTVHHPADYFYYLSQFAQGSYRWLTTVDLYTTEPIGPSFVGWSNVLVGRIFHIIGISHAWAYQISVALFTALLLFIAYQLALAVLGKKWPATLALFLFAIFHAFPIMQDGRLTYADYWNNIAVPYVHLGGVPHQLLIGIFSILALLFLIRKNNAGLLITSLVLASLQPVLWVLLAATILSTKNWKGLLYFLIGGVVPIWYLSQLFSSEPFLQLKLWESAQQTPLTLLHFILATGPIFLLAIFFTPRFLTSRSSGRLSIVLFPFFSILLFLSPLPTLLGVSHVRFMSSLTVMCLCIIAAAGLFSLRKKGLAIAIGLFLLLLPNHIKTITINNNIDTSNAYYYLPQGDYDIMREAAQISTPEDTFLVVWPYNVDFPGIAGRRSFHGHPLLTINAMEKDKQVEEFFSMKMSREAMENFLDTNHITYIISYPLTTPPEFLSPVSHSDSLIIYKVSL